MFNIENMMSCKHAYLHLDPSPFAELAGYLQPDGKHRRTAEAKPGLASNLLPRQPSLFPAPLVLPHDDLNYFPDHGPQSFLEWWAEEPRNQMTDRTRSTIYIAQIPEITKEVQFMDDWMSPNAHISTLNDSKSPNAEHYVKYLRAFYHKVNVETLPVKLHWTMWNKSGINRDSDTLPKYIALADNQQKTRIRVRKTPDGTFPAQLNLDDILSTAISILPTDAFALLLLVDHDLYETKDDDFCCGRAYGGSRVAVVQTARYNPVLDLQAGIDTAHMWPASHCKTFIDNLCRAEDLVARAPTAKQKKWNRDQTGMRCAVDAGLQFEESKALSPPTDPNAPLQALWFARLARTISHELGHCFAIGHCVYYACNMQGSATMKEDLRQPPYLCPVDEAKICHAIVEELHGAKEDVDKTVWKAQRGERLRRFCEQLDDAGLMCAMWSGYAAWLEERCDTASEGYVSSVFGRAGNWK